MIPMTSISTQNLHNSPSGFYSPAAFCRIVGLVCIVGFVIDILTIAFPPAFGSIEWRVNILQQISDRSIILLFGLALTLYSSLYNRPWRKYLVAICLTLGVVYLFSAILVVSSAIQLQSQTEQQINLKASQLQSEVQSQVQDAESNKIKAKPTPEQVEQAEKKIESQSAELKENSKKSTIKQSFSGVGNFLTVGIGLIALGQCGAKASRT